MSGLARQAIEGYLAYLRNERRMSPHTEKSYRHDVTAFASHCEQEGVERWSDVDSFHVRGYAALAHRSGLAPRSIARRLSAVRGFFEFLLRERLVRSNPARDVSAPKADRRLPATLDVDQIAHLLAIDGSGPLVARDRAMMELFYSSGLRLAELVAADIDALDLQDGTIRVTGKGSRTRIVPVGRYARRALKSWLGEHSRLARPGERALFLSQQGRRLSRRAVQARVRLWSLRQGLGVRMHPHLFRHSFASHLLESSSDLRGVQELLGHANIATTQIYTHLDFQHLARIYDQTHPRARRRR